MSDNFPCQEMFDIFQNAPKHPTDCLYEKKNLTLLSFPLFEVHQYLNRIVLIHPFGSQDMNVSLGTSNNHNWSLKHGWQQGPRVRTGAVSGLLGNGNFCTNDQSHLELPGLKSTFTYLSREGGFGKAVVEHK